MIVSKVKGGTLTFIPPGAGGAAGTPVDFSCQYTSVAITPDTETGGGADQEFVLCGDPIPAEATSSGKIGLGDTLDFTVVSDHNVANGLIAFSWMWRGKTVGFEFTPNKAPDEPGGAAQTFSGTVIMQPLTIGGEVQGDLRISGSLPIASLKPPAAYGPGYGASKGFAAPGTTYPADAGITAPDDINAAKLSQAAYGPYVAVPPTRWTTGQKITIGTFAFHWDGTKWAPGAAP